MSKFWDKVFKCNHKNKEPNYLENVNCATPFCNGDETRCADCGVFMTECGCGYCNGLSGWSEHRHRQKEFKEVMERHTNEALQEISK